MIADLIVTFIMDCDTHVTLGWEGISAAINGQCSVLVVGRWSRDQKAHSSRHGIDSVIAVSSEQRENADIFRHCFQPTSTKSAHCSQTYALHNKLFE